MSTERQRAIEQALRGDPFAAYLGAAIDEIGPGYARASLTVRPEMLNMHGTTHGGVIQTLADVAFAAASNSHGQTSVALDITTSFLRATGAGERGAAHPAVVAAAPYVSAQAMFTAGETVLVTPTASDPDGDPLTFAVSGKPAWANFDSSNGTLAGVPVTVLGLAFKPDTDDVRQTPAAPVIDLLLDRKARVTVYDPVALHRLGSLYPRGDVIAASSMEEAVREAAAVVLVTRWQEFASLPDVLERLGVQPLVVDGRRMLDSSACARYEGIGRG